MATGTLGGFQLDKAGGAEVLKMIAAEEISALTAAVAATAGPDAAIETKVSKTRYVGTVKVPKYQQAKDGVLSKAAAALGLQLNQYPKKDKPPRKKPAKAQAPRKRGRPRKSTTK